MTTCPICPLCGRQMTSATLLATNERTWLCINVNCEDCAPEELEAQGEPAHPTTEASPIAGFDREAYQLALSGLFDCSSVCELNAFVDDLAARYFPHGMFFSAHRYLKPVVLEPERALRGFHLDDGDPAIDGAITWGSFCRRALMRRDALTPADAHRPHEPGTLADCPDCQNLGA